MPYWLLGTEKCVRHLKLVVFLLCCIAAVDDRALCSIFLLKSADYRSGITFHNQDLTINITCCFFNNENVVSLIMKCN